MTPTNGPFHLRAKCTSTAICRGPRRRWSRQRVHGDLCGDGAPVSGVTRKGAPLGVSVRRSPIRRAYAEKDKSDQDVKVADHPDKGCEPGTGADVRFRRTRNRAVASSDIVAGFTTIVRP